MRVATGFTRYRGGEFAADRIIHTIGNFAGVVGSVILVGIAVGVAERPRFSWQASSTLFAFSRCSAARQPTTSPPVHPGEGFSANLIMPRSF